MSGFLRKININFFSMGYRMRWCKYPLVLAVASSSLCLSSGMQELSLLPFYTSPDNISKKLFSWLSAPFSGDLPMPEGSKNQLVIIDDDRSNRHQIIMLLPVNKEELVSTFILDSDIDTDVIPLPCDQDACIAWNYKGHVNVLDLSETVVESGRFETKAERTWEVIRTMGQNGDIIYQWYDQNGYLHTLSEWEFQRRLSVYFQSLLEYLYPEFFDSALPAGGGWHRWQYKNVRKASDRPEKNDQSLWQVQGRGKRRKKETKPVAVVKPLPARRTAPQTNPQQRHYYRQDEASTSSSTDEKGSIDSLLKEFEEGGLQYHASKYGKRCDGRKHGSFCTRIKGLTNARRAPLDNAEKRCFKPFMEHLSRIVYSFNVISLNACVHSLTISGLLDPHLLPSVRVSQQHLLEKLLDAIESQARQPHEPASLDAQAVSNHLLSLAKLVEREALTPEQTRLTVTALLPQVQKHQTTFNSQEIANQLSALAKLVEHKVITPKQASPAVTVLLLQVPQVQNHQTKFNSQSVANQLWALAKLVAHEVLTSEQASPAVIALLPQVLRDQIKFTPQEIVNQLWALAKLVESEVFTPEQTSPAVMALLKQVQYHQASFTPQGIANQLGALAKLVERKVLMPEQTNPAMAALLAEVQEHQAKFKPREVANLLWGLAVFGDWIRLDTISSILEILDIDTFESLQSQEMALWALTVFLARDLDQAAAKSSAMKLYKILKNEVKKDSSEKRATILRLSCVWLEENLQDLPIPDYKSTVTLAQTKQHYILTKNFPNHPLETEASVDGLPPVDLLFPREKVVIEIQGSYHYLDKEKQIKTGGTILKINTYKKLGYKVIEVHASGVSKPKVQKELHRELSTYFSNTEDDSVHNSCDSSDYDTTKKDKEYEEEHFSAED